jgi:hypothetical protein
MSSADRILAIVQAAPDISTNDSTYVASLIGQCMDFVSTYCCLDRFPDLAQGTSVSAAGASTDLSGLSSNSLLVAADGYSFSEIEITLANCTTGAATATELQTQIRAVNDENYLWAATSVSWDATATQYTITSPVYGADSRVAVAFLSDEWHVAQALKIGRAFGGVETPGGEQDDELEAVAAQMAVNAYRRIKLSPSDYDTTADRQAQLNSAFWSEDEMVKRLLLPRRRLRV